MNHIDRLNRRLGEALGLIANQPRFSWRWAPDLAYLTRTHLGESWTPNNWADRLGKVWVLTELRRPLGMIGDTVVPITEDDWWRVFRGTKPFEKLTPYVFTETALIPGLDPSEEKTAFYIASLREQIEKSVARLEQEGLQELAKDREDNHREFMDCADDSFPAFWSTNGGAHTPGTRGGHVSFGGIKS